MSFCSVVPDILLHTLPSCVVGHDKGSMLLIVLKISQSLSLSVSLKCAVVKEALRGFSCSIVSITEKCVDSHMLGNPWVLFVWAPSEFLPANSTIP